MIKPADHPAVSLPNNPPFLSSKLPMKTKTLPVGSGGETPVPGRQNYSLAINALRKLKP